MFTRTRRLAISFAMAAVLGMSLAACGQTTADYQAGHGWRVVLWAC